MKPLIAAIALVFAAYQSASAGLVGGFTATSSSGGATTPTVAFDPIGQAGTSNSDVFAFPNKSSVSYSIMDNDAVGAATVDWTINNTGSDQYDKVVFNLSNGGSVPSAVSLSGVTAPAGFSVHFLSATKVIFKGLLNPGATQEFGIALTLPDTATLLQSFKLNAHTQAPVPEPSSLILLGIGGVIGGAWLSRRRKAK
jgi:hypothetical protein